MKSTVSSVLLFSATLRTAVTSDLKPNKAAAFQPSSAPRSGIVLTIALNLPQSNGGRGDGGGTKVGGQRLSGVGGHAPKVLLPEHLPPGGRAGEGLRSILPT